MKYEAFYTITGVTQKGKNVYMSGFGSLKRVMKSFVEEFPRFNGEGRIVRKMAKWIADGVDGRPLYRTESDEYLIDSFLSTKELKETYLANH